MSSSTSIGSKLLRGGQWIALAALLNALLTVSSNGLLARLLSQKELGVYFALYSGSVTAASMCLLGMNQSIVRFVSSSLADEKPGLAKGYITTAFTLLAWALMALGAIVLACALPFGLELNGIAKYTGFALFFAWSTTLAIRTLIAESLRGFHEIGLATLFSGLLTSSLTVTILSLAYLVSRDFMLRDAIAIAVGSVLITIVISFVFLKRKADPIVAVTPPPSAREMAIRSMPLLGSTTGFLLMRDSHLWVLSTIAPVSEVALLGAALYFVRLLTVPLALANSLIQPSVAHLHAKGSLENLDVLLRGSAACVLFCALCGFAVLAIFGSPLMVLLYGENYAAAYSPLLIICLGQLVNVGVGSPGVLLAMTGHERAVLIAALSASLLGVVVTLMLGPIIGANGAATGIAVAVVIHNVMMWLLARVRVGIWTHASFFALKRGLAKLYLVSSSQPGARGADRLIAFLLRPIAGGKQR